MQLGRPVPFVACFHSGLPCFVATLHFGLENYRVVDKPSLVVYGEGPPTTYRDWNHNIGFQNRGVQRDTPMARRAAEETTG